MTLLASAILIGVLLRAAHLLNVYPTAPFSFHLLWQQSDMYIFDQWAQRIVAGDVLGRQTYHPIVQWMLAAAPRAKWVQWFGDTPVYLKAPLYAYLIALLRWLFGDPMLPLAILQILASIAVTVLLFRITEECFDTSCAVAAALLFALYGPAIHYDVIMLRGPWIALAALLVTWLLVRFQAQPTGRVAALLGLTVGVALLLNEGFMPVLPLVVALVAWWVRDLRRLTVVSTIYVLAVALVLVPLVVRNLIVGAPPLSLAVTGSYAFAIADAGYSEPLFFRNPPPSFLPLMEASRGTLLSLISPCLRSFPDVGSMLLLYLRRAAGLIVPFENPDNANFYYATFKDPVLRWLPTYAVLLPLSILGMSRARRRLRRLQALLPMSLTLLASIMLTLPMSRYRVTLAAFMFPFAGAALVQAIRWTRQRRYGLLGMSIGAFCLAYVAAEILQRHVVFAGKDPNHYLYRPAEFIQAAQTYVWQKRPREASQELLQLAQLTPDRTESARLSIQAARLLFQAGDVTATRTSLQALMQSGAGDAATLLSVGDMYWQLLNDPLSAQGAYQRAIVLPSEGTVAATLRARLDHVKAWLANR